MTTSAAGTPIVEVDALTKHFPAPGKARVHAVEQVSLQVGRGETLAIVGESGCGKSTLAYLIIRLLDPTSGTIRLDGTDITNLGPSALRPHRRKVQIVFQDPFASLDPRRPIGKTIGEPLEIHRAVPRRGINDVVATLLQRVGMSADDMSQYPHQFSGGQRQRICIARALALRPELVIADEAVSALDAVPIADPRQRRTDRSVRTDEIPSPVFEPGTAPEPVVLTEIEPGHLVAREEQYR